MNALINYLDKYHTQLTVLLLGLSLIVFAVFLWVWFYNRRKYHHLKHQIPASVVKNYLDSIIQNSTALKSSLFRGGGLEVDANGVPSVMPLSDLPSGAQVNISGGEDDSALRAEVSRLQSQLNEKNGVIKDLENQNAQLGGDVKSKQERIEELEKLLAAAKEGAGGGDPEADQKIAELVKERDRLEEDLKQYEVISDDLADLKRLKQENAQLKKTLEGSGGTVPADLGSGEPEAVAESAAPIEEAAPAESAQPSEASEPAADVAADVTADVAEDDEEDDMAAMAAAMMEDSNEEEPAGEDSAAGLEEGLEAALADNNSALDEPAAEESPLAAADDGGAGDGDEESKSPEDLLSEFEKMLG